MALHPEFPDSPHAILAPSIRWFPAEEELRNSKMEELMPPLVARLRYKVKEFRDSGYVGASDTSRSLLQWWFQEPHLLPQADGVMAEFQYYFAQREALETIVYLYDVVGVKDKFDLMRFDSSRAVSTGMFDENWRRFVVKMATGSGKTKVMSLAVAWSFFHRLYEPDSNLSRNFLIIAPNIIVLDRIYRDFQGLRVFLDDPVIPDNGYGGRNWQDDFHLTLHVQDEVRIIQPIGNIFLTNIHRVFSGDEVPPSPEDENTMNYFLGKRPTGGTTDSKVDLDIIVRDIDELMVVNDEAHHIHDPKMAWFKSIEDIHNRLLQKGGELSLQVDVTATPKHNNGAIFVQTIADYPLVEAISQEVVKHPILPDEESRAKLMERQSVKYTERYADYLDLGVIEWRKAFVEHKKLGKKAILFVMTDDTRNCDDVAEFLESQYPDFENAVLVIHTNRSGEISEARSGKKKDELEKLRKLANEIDDMSSPYKAIVSVMMLKEGWDVRNVTTIVGLRPYSAKSNILPEQTLGRGLRKMYLNGMPESVSVIGTDAFMEFVESIQAEGVVLERQPMGVGAEPTTRLMIEVDRENRDKDIGSLDIAIPILTRRMVRSYTSLDDLHVTKSDFMPVKYRQVNAEDKREIVFRDLTTGEIAHTTVLDSSGVPDYRSALGYFARTLMKDLRLVSGYEVLYGKLKDFVQNELFDEIVDLESPNTLRNLAETVATKTTIETFKRAINELTVQDAGAAQISDTIRLQDTQPFAVKDQAYLLPRKSVFNKVIGDSELELAFASFLESCPDVASYAKNYHAAGFKLDYVNSVGEIANYYPDFLVKLTDGRMTVAETKGLEDLDVAPKMHRLSQWCEDVNNALPETSFDFVYVDEESFHTYRPGTFRHLLEGFTAYK